MLDGWIDEDRAALPGLVARLAVSPFPRAAQHAVDQTRERLADNEAERAELLGQLP
jgi:hypothetical protein